MTSKRPYIVGFGIACIDYIAVAPAVEPGGHTYIESYTTQGGGLTGTAIVAASRLGARAKFLGRIGDDDIGNQIVESLDIENVDTSDLIRVPGAESLFSWVLVDAQTAERTIYCRKDRNIDCSTDLIALTEQTDIPPVLRVAGEYSQVPAVFFTSFFVLPQLFRGKCLPKLMYSSPSAP